MSERISVLIPVYNRENFIQESLTSISNQTYRNIDIIIFDDGSTDKTCRIIESFNDKRIKLIKGNKNKGVGYARNKLLEACSTKYACWHDSDDISNIYRIQLQYEQIKKAPNTLIFGHWAKLKYVKDKDSWEKYPETNNNKTQAFATLMFLVDKQVKFNEKLKLGGEDWNWIKRMLLNRNSVNILETIYYVQWHTDRIGVWKRKLKMGKLKGIDEDNMSYEEMLKYYKEHYGK